MPYGDDWGTDKGGFEDIGFDIQTSEWVAPEGNWRDYTWRVSGVVTDPDDGSVLMDSYTMITNLGPSWISDDGETVVNSRKDTARFPNNSKMGRFIEKLVELDDGGQIDLNAVGNPKLASSYVGLKLRLQRFEFPYDFKDRTTGEQVKGVSDQLLPVAVLEGSKGGTEKLTGRRHRARHLALPLLSLTRPCLTLVALRHWKRTWWASPRPSMTRTSSSPLPWVTPS